MALVWYKGDGWLDVAGSNTERTASTKVCHVKTTKKYSDYRIYLEVFRVQSSSLPVRRFVKHKAFE